jgi:Peptidase A4 family
MRTTKLPGGVTIRTFSSPPDGFDPVQADDRALLAYGYPGRPKDPELLERWERVLSGRVRLIQPTFRAMPYKRRRLPKVTAGAAHGTETTDIWSGAVVHAPAGDSFTWVEGEWTVPNAFPPPHAVDGVWYSASTWIGIDGIDGSGDVLQAGCDSDVMTSGGTIQRQLNPWWEWYPAGSFWISNLPVAQGDTMDGVICVDAGSTTTATIYLLNVTSGVGASFRATAPSRTSLVGNCAEWVVERLEIDTNTPELARYGDVYFAAANAGTVANALLNAGDGNVIDMVDSGSNIISTGLIETPTLVQVRYTGPAY